MSDSVDSRFDPILRVLAVKVANKVSRLPKFVINRLPDDKLYDLIIDEFARLPEDEVHRLIEAEIHTMFRPFAAVMSFLFPRTAKSSEITPPENRVVDTESPPVNFTELFLIVLGGITAVVLIKIGFEWLENKLERSSIILTTPAAKERLKRLKRRLSSRTSDVMEVEQHQEGTFGEVEQHQEDTSGEVEQHHEGTSGAVVPRRSTGNDPKSLS